MKKIATLSLIAALAAAGLMAGDKPSQCCSNPQGCMQMMQTMQGGGMDMSKMQGMMQGMTPALMERMRLLMRVPIFLDAPCPIYAQSDNLGLSEEQKKQLVEIEKEARQKARAVLTPDQQKRLGEVPEKPITMMETCPMMKMMQGTQQDQASTAKKTK